MPTRSTRGDLEGGARRQNGACWQGLAQLADQRLKRARRGNARGAVALLRRGGSAVAGYGR